MYADFVEKYKSFLTDFGSYLTGNNTAPTFDATINFATEHTILQNASSAETLIYTTNAMYDQAAVMRTIKEMYKTPKDYFADYKVFLANQQTTIEFLGNEFERQSNTIKTRMNVSKSIKSFSPTLQKKLSLIDPQV